MDTPQPTQPGPSTELAHTLLADVAAQYELTRQRRIDAARKAKDHGLSYRQIAAAYGVTEGAIRFMLKNPGGAK